MASNKFEFIIADDEFPNFIVKEHHIEERMRREKDVVPNTCENVIEVTNLWVS